MTKKKNRLQSSLYPLLFLLSASGIALEVSLTRLFSYLFTHSYVYIIISVSMAGLGLGSVLMRILQGGIRQKVLRTALFLPAFLAGVLLLSSLLQAAVIVSLLMAFFIFMTIGLFQVLVFQQPQVQAGKLYASDLSGAAFGSVAAFLVLNL
jgi:predicted membrane-bound spermidine synthase